jgi:YD repeat-containing protein
LAIQSARELQSTYDSWNLRTKLQKTKPTTGAAVTYAYNALGQLASINDLAGKLTTLRYNSDHLLDLTTLPSGLQIAEGYISNHGKLGVEYTVPALDDVLGLAYAQNPKGFISSRFNAAADRERSYQYDPQGRLKSYQDESIVAAQYNCGSYIIDPDTGAICVTQGQRTTLASAAYTYDAVGNRTDSGAATSYSYNRPPAFAGYTLTYDADGLERAAEHHQRDGLEPLPVRRQRVRRRERAVLQPREVLRFPGFDLMPAAQLRHRRIGLQALEHDLKTLPGRDPSALLHRFPPRESCIQLRSPPTRTANSFRPRLFHSL